MPEEDRSTEPQVLLVRMGHALVAVVLTDAPPPSTEEVQALMDAIRDERGTDAA